MPIVQERRAIITSHYNEALVRNDTRSMVLSTSWDSSPLLTYLKLAIYETLKLIFANWQHGVFLRWTRSSPEIGRALKREYWKSNKLELIFASDSVSSHRFTVHFDYGGIVLVGGWESSEDKYFVVDEDDPMACSGVEISFDGIRQSSHDSKLIIHHLIL